MKRAFFLAKNKHYSIAGEYNSATDTWSWNSKDVKQLAASMAIGEQSLSVFRLTTEQPSTEDGVQCEYRYELPYFGSSNQENAENGKVNECVYVRYRPAKEEGAQDEMLLEVRRERGYGSTKYTVTFYETGAEPITAEYPEKNESEGDRSGEILEPVDDPSSVEGVPMTFAEADFLPNMPAEKPALERGEEAWVLRGLPEIPKAEPALYLECSDSTYNCFYFTAIEGEQGAYAMAKSDMERLQSDTENETAPITLVIESANGYPERPDIYVYAFDKGYWEARLYVKTGDNYYYAYFSHELTSLSLNTLDGATMWYAEYDKDGKVRDVYIPLK
jgi:hypothetical protein